MAGFRKAKAEQAFIKLGAYGPPGSGKTLTGLICAEGLAKVTGKRIAVVDTERGTDFYCQAVPERTAHPEAFDFDALYSRSIVEVVETVKAIDPTKYGVVIIDSISHIWDAAIGAYKGKKTSIGSIPLQAWGDIKKPYKELMAVLLSLPMHVIICGRQSNEMGEGEGGELTKIGVKMRAEGETQYEPHITLRMESTKPRKAGEVAQIMAIVEKDRTGLLQGKVIINPTFDKLLKPILPLLGDTQAKVETEEETGQKDAEAMVSAEARKAQESAKTLAKFRANLDVAATVSREEIERVGKTITAEVKKAMLPAHVAELRQHFLSLTANGAKHAPAEEVAAHE